jgi:hypothetical protein
VLVVDEGMHGADENEQVSFPAPVGATVELNPMKCIEIAVFRAGRAPRRSPTIVSGLSGTST